MADIDRQVIGSVSRQAATWRAAGHDLLISVNLSAAELDHETFSREFAGLLMAYGGDGTGLEVELTEHTVMGDFDRVRAQLDDLRARAPGLRLALDDFGTGYSALKYLRRLPIDTLKIDRSFVTDPDPQAVGIAQTIVALGHQLGLRVVAEGVEEAAQIERVVAMGCDEVQGFAFAYPVPPPEFERWLLSLLPEQGAQPALPRLRSGDHD